MKLRIANQIELSVANLKALYEEVQRQEADGKPVNTLIYKNGPDGAIAVSVVADDDHYSDEELAERNSPYLAPEAWAGVL